MKAALLALQPYIEAHLASGGRLHAITRHLVGAFHSVPGARAFRRVLAEQGVRPDADFAVLRAALDCVRDEAVAARLWAVSQELTGVRYLE